MKKLAKTALVGSLVASVAGVSPFAVNAMAQGYQNQATKCDKKDAKCVAKTTKATKKAEAKCGEAKCGGAAAQATKKAEAKCGEAKCGGTTKTTKPATTQTTKKTEAKCGEAKCGGSK